MTGTSVMKELIAFTVLHHMIICITFKVTFVHYEKKVIEEVVEH